MGAGCGFGVGSVLGDEDVGCVDEVRAGAESERVGAEEEETEEKEATEGPV